MKLSFLLPFLLASPLSALPNTEPPHVKADLLSESTTVRPGTPFTVAVRLRHDPGWHTYWRNPGVAPAAGVLRRGDSMARARADRR